MFGIATKVTVTMAAVLVACGAVTNGHAEDNEMQGGTDKRLLACDELTDARDKLACFDSVVESVKAERAAASKAEQSTTQPAAVSSSKNPSDTIARDPAATPSDQGHAREPAAVATAPTPVGDDAAGDSSSSGRSASTATGNDDDADERGPVRARIVRAWQNLDGRFSVELDNGQIWRETQGTDVGLPAEGDRVEISEGLFGGHRMKIEDITRVAWVRRAE